MKITQKLEIGLGLSSSIILLSYLCFLILYFGLINEVTNTIHDGLALVVVVWFFSLFVAVGAYYDAAKQSTLAFISLCIGGVFVIVILTFIWLVTLIWVMTSLLGLLFTLLTLIPAILSAVTITLAVYSKIKAESLRTKTSFETHSV